MRVPRPRRILAIGVVVAAIVALGGTADAIWTGSGGGNGSASSGTVTPVTLSPGTPDTLLYPGGSADVVLTVHNPGSAEVHIGSLSLDKARGEGGYSVDALHSGCSVSTFGFSASTNSGAGWTVPAQDSGAAGLLPIALSDALSMDENAANACQGATATVYLVAGS
jgi:hypothetical protein